MELKTICTLFILIITITYLIKIINYFFNRQIIITSALNRILGVQLQNEPRRSYSDPLNQLGLYQQKHRTY